MINREIWIANDLIYVSERREAEEHRLSILEREILNEI